MERHLAFGLAWALAACSTAEHKGDIDARGSNDSGGGSNVEIDAALTDGNGATDGGGDAPTVGGPNCGNGTMDSGEACDDNNIASNDGCSSACVIETTQTVTMMALNLTVTDDNYTGTLASMTCVSVPVTAWYTPTIATASIVVGMDHGWIGDLVFKAVAPDNTVVTLVSRPGYTEPADDGSTTTFGTGADLAKGFPITFVTGAATSAESMGVGLSTVCQSDNVCMFAPANGAAAAGTLAAFTGKPSTGTWKLCAGDGSSGDTGKLDRVSFTFNH